MPAYYALAQRRWLAPAVKEHLQLTHTHTHVLPSYALAVNAI